MFIGLDAGSVSVKFVMLDEKGNKLDSLYIRHKGHPLKTAVDLLKNIMRSASCVTRKTTNPDLSLSIAGSSGKLIASVLGIEPVNELIAQAFATRKLFPHIKTIIELGGEDSKLILLGETGVKEFSMNSICAAGTGSFLDQQAERLQLTIEEFGELSLRSKRPPRIAGRCSVFAKSDMIHLQQIATPAEDIVAGLCFAVARNFKGSISRGRKIEMPVSFHGGVAANKGMVRAFKDVFELEELFVPSDFALMGALGAVFKDIDEGRIKLFDITKLEDFINSEKPSGIGYKPLVTQGDNFYERHLNDRNALSVMSNKLTNRDRKSSDASRITHHASRPLRAYLGIDIGSISTNLALIDENGRLLSKRYLMTAGKPIEAVKQGLNEIGEEIGDKVEITGVGTTGSGRYMIADYVGADIVKNEITAQATAAAFIDRKVDTIFEIGGQDSKYISLKDGVIIDFEMNKACAAGTGSFLEEQAEKLNIPIKEEFASLSFSAENPCRLGERCTVFMENSLMSNLQRGVGKNNLLAGLSYSIVQNYINRVVAGKKIGDNIFFQGGVAFNKSVVAAFEKYLDKKITVPPYHDVTGAIGMAMIARDYMKEKTVISQQSLVNSQETNPPLPPFTKGGRGGITTFKGFELSKRSYSISSFECKGCPNVCEINRVNIEGENDHLFYGGRCEKYDVRKKKSAPAIPDLFTFREEMLWKEHNKYIAEFGMRNSECKPKENHSAIRNQQSALRIGIPYIFYFHDYLPFWSTLLWEIGFDVEVSPKTNRQIVNLGLESILSETCFPVKVAYGHIKHLLDTGVDAVFIPSFINLNTEEESLERGFACPYTQTIPYVTGIAFSSAKKDISNRVEIISPVVDLKRGKRFMLNELSKAFKSLGIKKEKIKNAISAAEHAQNEFKIAIRQKGKEIFYRIQDTRYTIQDKKYHGSCIVDHESCSVHNASPIIVIVGRAYNSFDRGMNLDIPKKLANLNALSIPMDFLPLDDHRIDSEWPNMYWRAGQRILKAARIIKENPNLYPLYIGNFSCGPDSFILKYFKKELYGKPFLHIEIDEHSADAGAITRCEAFLDSMQNKDARCEMQDTRETKKIHPVSCIVHHASKTIFIPHMSDHAFALSAAFERCGLPAKVLPESDKDAIDISKMYVSGKECYPCAVTTGDMLKKVLSSDFRPEESAFFMPSGSGPCRFGQYNVFHRLILDEFGYPNVPIFSPNQDVEFYRDLGIVGRDFTTRSWMGIVAIELLTKCLHETRPYEKENGLADSLYQEYLKKITLSLKANNGKAEDILLSVRRDFENVPRYKELKPLIGIIGEIFVRSNKFSNENLIRKIESLGGEVWLAPVEEWIYYVNLMAVQKALLKRNWSAIMNTLLKTVFQKRIEHRYSGSFKGFLKTLREPDTKEIIEKASPYLHRSFEGEAILSIGKAIDLIERGASGIVNAMPFGCMPGTIVTALMQGLSRDYGTPCISIPYDGTESSTTEIQLEAFMHQAKEYRKHDTRYTMQDTK
ncbi:MAG: CoA protein activase [Nitrospirae bacterium]|nr:CoA protein activase [Nitrospirota bacterium]